MIEKIVKNIIPYLESLNFSEVVGGIATTISQNKPTKDNKIIVKKFPAYYNENKTTCNASDYIDLVPNSNKRSIIYFENNGIKISPINGNIIECVADVRLVCWANLKKINDTFINADTLKLLVIQAMPVSLSNVFPYSFIRIELTGEETKSVALFSKYTYNEEEKQYLIYPFDYFALNYEISFYVGINCIDPILISPSVC